jgi:hypothetical protein
MMGDVLREHTAHRWASNGVIVGYYRVYFCFSVV